jgi:hypothetical protein
MADEVSAAVESSGPESTADVATEVYESLESAETTPEAPSAVEAPVDLNQSVDAAFDKPKPAETPAIVQPPLSEEEKLLQEFGFKEHRREDGREHRIARSKVLQMIASGLKRGQDRWGTEKQTIEQERAQYRADLDEMYADLRGEPKAFIAKLAQHDERYKAFLEGPPAAPQAPAQPVGEMPSPDVTLHDGSMTYSIDGLKKLLEWSTANVEARLMPKLDERLKPWQEREKALKQSEEREKADKVQHERVQRQMNALTKQPMFGAFPADGSLTPFQQEVLKVMQEDTAAAKAEKRPMMTPLEAYYTVERKKLTVDRNTHREELLKEINGAAAKTPTTTHGGAEVVKKQGPADTRSIAARIIEQAGG